MSKFGTKEVMDVTFYDIETGAPVLFLDSLKMTNLENTAETVYARGGKGNPRLIGWDFGREATMSIQDALGSMQTIGMLAGTGVVDASAETAVLIHAKEEGVISATSTPALTIALSKVPEAGTLHVFFADGTKLAPKGEGALAVGEFELTVDDILFHTDDTGEAVVMYYQYETETGAQVITVDSNKFPGYYKIVGDTVVRNLQGTDESFQMVIPKAKLQPGFTMTFQAEGDPGVFDMNIDIFKADSEDTMVKMIKY